MSAGQTKGTEPMRHHTANRKLRVAIERVLPGQVEVRFRTRSDGGKEIALRLVRDLPPEVSDRVEIGCRPLIYSITDGKPRHDGIAARPGAELKNDEERPDVLRFALQVAREAAAELKNLGVTAEYQEHFLLRLFPPIGLVRRGADGRLRPATAEEVAALRALRGPDDPVFQARYTTREPRVLAGLFASLQHEIAAFDQYAWQESESPYSDEHWVPTRYAGIGVHLKGELAADAVTGLLAHADRPTH